MRSRGHMLAGAFVAILALTLGAGILLATQEVGPYPGGGITNGTAGGVLRSAGGSTIAEDVAHLFWNESDLRLGIGTSSPVQALDVFSGNIRLSNAGGLSSGVPGYVEFDDDQTPPNSVSLKAPDAVTANYVLKLPADSPTIVSQPLCYGGAVGQLIWCNPLSTYVNATDLNTKTQALLGTHPAAAVFCTAADGNQDVTGGAATCDGLSPGGGAAILTAQTDPTQNGLWTINQFGAWAYDLTWGDQSGGCSASDGYILTVKSGGTVYGNTTWQVKCVAGNATFVQVPVATRSGTCTVASTTLSTTAANETCTGVPATTHTVVTCSGQSAFSTPTANGVYCRSTGTVNQIACNTAVTNTTAMAYNCSWVQP